MTQFHEALRAAEDGTGQAKAMFYGASHVASDTYTGRLRRLLQRRIGKHFSVVSQRLIRKSE